MEWTCICKRPASEALPEPLENTPCGVQTPKGLQNLKLPTQPTRATSEASLFAAIGVSRGNCGNQAPGQSLPECLLESAPVRCYLLLAQRTAPYRQSMSIEKKSLSEAGALSRWLRLISGFFLHLLSATGRQVLDEWLQRRCIQTCRADSPTYQNTSHTSSALRLYAESLTMGSD